MMPGKKKRVHKRKNANKQVTKSKSIAKDEKNTTSDGHSHSTPGVALDKTPEPNKKRNCRDKDDVKRLYSTFNRFATNTSSRLPNSNKSTKNMAFQSTYKSTGLSPKEKSYIICSCQTKSTRYLSLKRLAMQAIENRKIFTIYGCCNAARKALTERGWVEKIPPNRMNLTKIKNGTINTKPEIHTELERLLLSSLVNKCTPNFIWHTKDEIGDTTIDMTNKDCTIIENKLRTDALWTSKQGLCASMKRNYWFYIEDVSEVTGPRSYNTCDAGEVEDFVKDYKTTACTSLLKWVLSMVANDRPVFSKSGRISLNIIVFALNRCKEYLFRKQNRDIDRNINNTSAGQWNTFLKKYYRIIGKDDIFEIDKENKLPLYLGYARFLLKEIYKYRPQLSCEGCLNIWIIKPAHNCRGRGIRMASKLAVITNLLNKTNSKYVIQKYIEEPLLIYETKFDIRQYYLVTSTHPLVIWMYQDCYLKFSSQKYNLMDYHEAIHLTNNAVQRKYTNCTERHWELPQNNMWDLDMYKNYLNKIGQDNVWDNIIYPGMKKSIIAIMLSCQDTLPVCKNRFELYGCDFILDKMYKPWLIEINSSPDLNHTTPVTAKICPAVIADIIKVVIDYPHDHRSSTGKFECIYRQPMSVPRYGTAADLIIRGYSLPNSYFYVGPIPVEKSTDDDSVDIEKSYNSQAILKKIKQYYDMDTVMVRPEGCRSESVHDFGEQLSSRVHSEQSEFQLSVAATIITSQLEELLDQIPSNSNTSKSKAIHTPQSLSKSHSVKSETDVESLLKECISRIASIEIVNLMQESSSKITSLNNDLNEKGSLVQEPSFSFSPLCDETDKIYLIEDPLMKLHQFHDDNEDETSKNINVIREPSCCSNLDEELSDEDSIHLIQEASCSSNQVCHEVTSTVELLHEMSKNLNNNDKSTSKLSLLEIPSSEHNERINDTLGSTHEASCRFNRLYYDFMCKAQMQVLQEQPKSPTKVNYKQLCNYHEACSDLQLNVDESTSIRLSRFDKSPTCTNKRIQEPIDIDDRTSGELSLIRDSSFKQGHINNGPTGQGNACREGMRNIFTEYSQSESLEYQNNRSKCSEDGSTSKSIILEATSKMFKFIRKKEKEYFSVCKP